MKKVLILGLLACGFISINGEGAYCRHNGSYNDKGEMVWWFYCAFLTKDQYTELATVPPPGPKVMSYDYRFRKLNINNDEINYYLNKAQSMNIPIPSLHPNTI